MRLKGSPDMDVMEFLPTCSLFYRRLCLVVFLTLI